MAEINEGFDSPPEDVANHGVSSRTDELSSRSTGRVRGATVSFHDFNYSVEVPGKCCRKSIKQILFDVSGVFRPGMNGIMGPTGSGKTTLLDILAARCDTTGLSGHLLIDGKKQPKNYKCMTGYVVQDDVVMGTLTVRENLMFSANLRLPESVKLEERERIVEDAIRELGLERCANTKIGTQFFRGVSGGERKRCNVGMELITSPSILFLDEPTTGLDANTAYSVMSMLHRLSRKGCTIIFSIHQPRFSIYKLFDRLTLLAAGRTIYHGKASETLDFFRYAGYECEEFNNPSDFFLDIINGDSSAVNVQEESSIAKKATNYGAVGIDGASAVPNEDTVSDGSATRRDRGTKLVAKFNESRWHLSMKEELKPILSRFLESSQDKNTIVDTAALQPHYATSFVTQLKYLSRRAFINFLRNPQASIMQIVVSVFLAIALGLIFLQLDHSYGALQSRYGAMFFLTTSQLFSNLSAIEIFIHERAIFAHESASGFYRVSSYFISKIFCDLIPMRAFPLTLFIIITYFMIGFQHDAGHFFIFYLDLLLTTIAASGIALFMGASFRTFAIANLLTVLVYVISMIFGGLLANLKLMGKWISWLQYLSLVRYSLRTLSVTELKALRFYANGPRSFNITGVAFLDQQEIRHSTGWDLWQNILAIGLIAIGMEFLAYVQLRRMKKWK